MDIAGLGTKMRDVDLSQHCRAPFHNIQGQLQESFTSYGLCRDSWQRVAGGRGGDEEILHEG